MANQSPAAGKQKRHEQTDQLDIEKSTTPNFSTSVLMGDSAMVALFGCERVPKSGCRTSESASRNASKRPRGRKRVTCAGSLYENSLVLAMGAVFLATWLTQSVNGWRAFNARQQSHDEPSISWASYVRNPDFWNRTLQNWQSEFLAVGTMAVFTIYLRQRFARVEAGRRPAAIRAHLAGVSSASEGGRTGAAMHGQPDPLSDEVFDLMPSSPTDDELPGFISSRLAPVVSVDLVEQTLRDDDHDWVELSQHAKRRPTY
jgi:hypothetical protein